MEDAAARARAKAVLGGSAAILLLGLVILLAFDPSVQTIDADELVDRKGDARAFLAADYVFVALYAIVVPLVLSRFARTLAGRGRAVALAAAGFLVAAGVADLVENTLLFAASGSGSQAEVDAAHAFAVPKVAFFIVGAALTLAVCWFAVRALRSKS